MAETELLSCPFCGGEAEVKYGCWDYNCYLVECKSCAGTVIDTRWDSPEEAIEAWNRRV